MLAYNNAIIHFVNNIFIACPDKTYIFWLRSVTMNLDSFLQLTKKSVFTSIPSTVTSALT